MSRVTADEIRALGYAWPISATVTEACSERDGQIALAAPLAMLERNLAFHTREQDDMYAFASQWNADIDDTTDRRGDVAEAIENHHRAIAAVRTLRELFDQPPAQRRPRTPTPPPPPPTAEELAATAARIAEITRQNAPLERAAIAGVLATYFEGPIDDGMIDRLHAAANGTPDAGYSNARGGFVRWPSYEGQAWLEELGDNEFPSRTQRAAFIAASRPGFPAVRWHRPPELVGIWSFRRRRRRSRNESCGP